MKLNPYDISSRVQMMPSELDIVLKCVMAEQLNISCQQCDLAADWMQMLVADKYWDN